MDEWITSKEGSDLLGVPQPNFLYYAKNGDIAIKEPEDPRLDRLYSKNDTLKVRKRLIIKKRVRKSLPPPVLIDWMYAKDLAAGVKLAQTLYDDSVDLAEMAVYQSWRKNNQHLTLAAFNADRSEAYASIQVVPLPESVILDVLSGQRTENSIQPDEIRGDDEPGEYTLLGTSAIVLPDRPELLFMLLRRYMEYWVEMFPDRFISRIYAQAVSESGDRLASSLYMAPMYHIKGEYPAFMLDLARPGRAKIIRWFKDELASKAELLGIELPEALQHPYELSLEMLSIPQPVPVTPIYKPEPEVTSASVTSSHKSRHEERETSSTAPPQATGNTTLPPGYRGFTEFFNAHGIAETTAGRAEKEGAFQVIRNGWKVDGKSVKKSLDPDGQRAFCERFRDNPKYPTYHECKVEGCPCHLVVTESQ